MSIHSIKYVFKYVYKGHDCASIEQVEVDPLTYDEIKTYLDTRYLSAPEACWRLREFPLSEKSHTVIRLDIHLHREHNVVFRENSNLEEVVEESRKTKLTEYFTLNRDFPDARRFLYTEIPLHYTWNNGSKTWSPRKTHRLDPEAQNIVTRMYYVSPKRRECFYLRILLLHVTGATSYEDLKKYNGQEYATFCDSCKARGLLSDDSEWHDAMEEACISAMPVQLRDLFVTILANCQPNNPKQLWDDFKQHMVEDFVDLHGENNSDAEQSALRLIDRALKRNYRLEITDFGIDLLYPDTSDDREHVDIDLEQLESERQYGSLTSDQTFISDSIMHEVRQYGPRPCLDNSRVYFIDASGGCGKTYLFNALISMCLAEGHGVAACAWTGIASTLLRFGRTTHSLFKLPVPILNTSTCNVSANSRHANYLRSLSLIVIDEASMIPLHAFSAIDILLRDLCQNDIPFGGKLLVLAGDFRQTLPVIPRAHAAEVLENCINRSHLWRHVRHFKLTENIRADPDETEFKTWLLNLGDGSLKSSDPHAEPGQIDIPSQCKITTNVINDIFPDFNVDRSHDVIVTPLNTDVDTINSKVINIFRPEVLPVSYFSVDTVIEDENNEVSNITTEFLNSVTPSGMPEHDLKLKEGCPIILIRNLDQKKGLCNGTRLIVKSLGARIIEAEIISGSRYFIGNKVFIPRIKLCPSDLTVPFKFERVQFPVKLAYCLTINKSQGQGFDKIGICLPLPVFSHGQLYVAFSRGKRFNGIYIEISDTPHQFSNASINVGRTVNVVYNI